MSRSYRFATGSIAVHGLASRADCVGATLTPGDDTDEVHFPDGADWRPFDSALPVAPLEVAATLPPRTISIPAKDWEAIVKAKNATERNAALAAALSKVQKGGGQ